MFQIKSAGAPPDQNEPPTTPPPVWKPDVPVEEPQPDLLPDELPKPNPDENGGPPIQNPGAGI